MPLNLRNCSQDCTDCIRSYIKKHRIEAGQNFDIRCKGIIKEEIQLELFDNLDQEDKKTALTMINPLKWAAETLDWHCIDPDGEIWKRKNPLEYQDWIDNHPGESIEGQSRYHRPYQKEILDCTSKRKVFRMGRQLGKCLASGSLIQMADGTLKPIEKIVDGDGVISFDKDYKPVINTAYCATNGIKPVYLVKLMDGREIKATGNHPFLTRRWVRRQTRKEAKIEDHSERRYGIYNDEWTETLDLNQNHYVAVPNNIDTTNYGLIDDRYLTILGCMLADGNLTSNNCRFSNQSPEVVKHLRDALSIFNSDLIQYASDNSDIDYHLTENGPGRKSNIREWFKDIGIWGLDSHSKYIPDSFMQLGDDNIVELLRCMFGCNGRASVDKNGSVQIEYSTVSNKLAIQIISLLSRFGIYADLRDKKVKLDGKTFWSKQICISRKQSINNFKEKIGILSKDHLVELVYKISQSKGSSPKTEAYEENNLTFIRVKEVVYLGEEMTWDLTVPGTHNFIANGMVTHNTEVIVIAMLFHMFTKPEVNENEGFEIIVITPYQAQIDLIFNRMLQLIRSSPLTQNSLKRHVKSPIYAIELYNGSIVKGFTAGTRSGGNAEAVRGQHGNMLVFDEADYLGSGDMDAALAIITNYPNASCWMSSTPSGKRERFYQTCFSKLWKEFHYTSHANPMFKEVDKLYKENMTELGYKHEVLADFAEQEEGVFQNVYIQAAKSKYDYGDLPYDPTWIYTIGVDWNDTRNGTTIIVTGLDAKRNKYHLVDKRIVQKEGWTQMTACHEIAALNRTWRPKSIYIDAGYGSTQWEFLRAIGYEALRDPNRGPGHPDSRLKDIVTKYDFGSKVTTHDLFTKVPIQKDAKPFLVENTVRHFETEKVVFPREDIDLEKQLQGYIIARITQTGRPVYELNDSSIGDHILDAMMLSLVAFTMEVSPMGRPQVSVNIGFTGRFGEVTDVETYAGDTVVKHQDSRQKIMEKERDRYRPSQTRCEQWEQQSLFPDEKNLPASNTNEHFNEIKPWRWDGFGYDSPRPKVRSLSQAKSDAKRRLGINPRKGGKPRRKNI